MDGQTVLHRLCAAWVTTPVIMLSGYGETERKVRALSSGSDDCIPKPYERRELLARIQAVIRARRGSVKT